MKKVKPQPCTNPRPFTYAPDVCRDCGHLFAQHPQTCDPYPISPEQAWEAMINHGGVYSYRTGDIDQGETPALHQHMTGCAVNLAESATPRMNRERVFGNTLASDRLVTVVSADMTCGCGHYSGLKIVLERLTFSQLVWLALNE